MDQLVIPMIFLFHELSSRK